MSNTLPSETKLAYYNEHDPKAAAWLRELIKNGHIAPGEVDERSIEDIRPAELSEFTQCHFFAGIGGWSQALRLSGWPDNKPVWTGSCPCQPFSAAGKGGGFDDIRHLWPVWFHLIEQRKPSVIFGEQVASKDGLQWFDLVSTDLENAAYSVAAADLCAASVGAPHIRQRLFFVANSSGTRLEKRQEQFARNEFATAERSSDVIELAHTPSRHAGTKRQQRSGQHRLFTQSGSTESVVNAEGEQARISRCTWFDGRPVDWIECLDGKSRPVEPGTFPLAHGISDRMGLIRGYGNAIVPQVAAKFIEAYGEATCPMNS